MSDSLGQILSKARRSRGYSLKDADAATRVRAKLLDALERGDYDALPNPAYVRGYIIGYAKFLELDPKPLLDLFAAETGHTTAVSRDRRLHEQVVSEREKALVVPGRTLATIAAAILIIALTLWGIGRALSGGSDEIPPPPTVPETTTTAEPTAAIEAAPIEPAVPADQDPGENANGEPFTLRITVIPTGASWLRVTVDGLNAYEGTLTGGQSKEWEVTDSATIRVGKPSAVEVSRDGVTVELPTAANTPELTLSVDDELR
ncbi:MAG: helix-turn-helix domain-containing protein [Coriobacteriia bacterium]|nr:helix-turn-helix domain-containing protein [Coriobacteriia bacterium]